MDLLLMLGLSSQMEAILLDTSGSLGNPLSTFKTKFSAFLFPVAEVFCSVKYEAFLL